MIYITGDAHGELDFHKLNTKNFPVQRDLTKEDYVIIWGDFGGVWAGMNHPKDKWLLEWYEAKTLLPFGLTATTRTIPL